MPHRSIEVLHISLHAARRRTRATRHPRPRRGRSDGEERSRRPARTNPSPRRAAASSKSCSTAPGIRQTERPPRRRQPQRSTPRCELIRSPSSDREDGSGVFRRAGPDGDQSTEAAEHPAIAAAIAARYSGIAAILAHDVDVFAAGLAPDLVVNTPANRVARRDGLIQLLQSGSDSVQVGW
jgi:hypothetical protein